MTKHTLFPQKVTLEPVSHKYTDAEGNHYLGFSGFYKLLNKPFDADMMASVCAKSEEVSKQEILNRWDATRELGNYYDKALEECVNPMFYEKYSDIADVVKSVLAEYDFLHSTFEQAVVFNQHYKIAGSPDKFGISSTRKGATFSLFDYKVFEKDDLHEVRGWLLEPLQHLPATKFIKIALQLSFYSFQLEELTGMRVKNLWIHLINPTTKTHQKVYVPYMKTEIQLCLELFKERIATLVAPKQETMF